MIQKLILLTLFVFQSVNLRAQTENQTLEDAWIFFQDKPLAQNYILNPTTMLSQRSLDRRARQNIALNQTDVPVHIPYIQELTSQNLQVKAKSKWLNAVHVQGTQNQIEAVRNFSFIQNIEYANKSLNSSSKIKKELEFTASSSATQSLQNFRAPETFTYGTTATQVQMIKADYLHNLEFNGLGMHIAVIDAGFPGVNTVGGFSRIRNNNQILSTRNYVTNSTNVYTANWHGTGVLSTMAGYLENRYVGTAPNASYHLFVTEADAYEGPLEESWWVEAVERADSLGVDLVNSSLGYRTFDRSAYNYITANMDGQTSFIARGANFGLSKGMIIVNSNGNYRGSTWNIMGTPADNSNVFSIGAVTNNRTIASFSSPGPTADNRIKPDVSAMGQAAQIIYTDNAIYGVNGTSFSAPIITGALACFWQAFPDKKAWEILELVKQSAHLYSNPDNDMGYGIPNFELAYNQTLSSNSHSKQQINIYPNPVKSTIQISLPDSIQTGTFILFNNQGQILYKTIISQNQLLNLENLSSGIYLYKINTLTENFSGKIIKK